MKYELRGVHLIQIPLCLQCVFHLILFVSMFVFVFVFVLFLLLLLLFFNNIWCFLSCYDILLYTKQHLVVHYQDRNEVTIAAPMNS